jgi:endoglucanase
MNFDFLNKLVSAYSTSGYEDEVVNVFKSEVENNVPEAKIILQDHIKNIVFSKGNGPKRVLLSGHSDWIAFQVFGITEHGFVRIRNIGGSDRRTLPGSKVIIVTEEGKKVIGVVGIRPIHVTKPEERGKIDDYENIVIDLGCSSKEEVESLGIELGNPVYFESQPIISFGPSGDRICATGLDDRAGIYIATEVFKQVNNPNIELLVAAFSQEEVGLRGAGIGSGRLNADISIDIDVCPSTESEIGISKDKFGDTELGKGAVISYGCTKNVELCKELKKVARDNKIPFQIEVTAAGGTNTEFIQNNSKDCQTALISLPNRNMHTQVEMCSWTDIKSAIDILVKYLEKL